MSFNRLIYDQCAYAKDLDQQSSILSYTLDPNKHYNCNPCRIGFGILGGNVVSLDNVNLVDLESDISRNLTRVNSLCPERKYLPQCKPNPRSKDGLPCSSAQLGSCSKRNLPECNLINYRPRIKNSGIELNYPTCPNPVACNRRPRPMTAPCQNTLTYNHKPIQQGYREFYTF